MHEQIAVIIFDREGRVRSASGGAGALLGGVPAVGASAGEAFAASPELGAWLGIVGERSGTGDDDACVISAGLPAPVEVRFAPLGADGFAVVATGVEAPAVDPGSVSQRTWHDIKNQLGGIKLYATFLKKRLGEAEPLVKETAEKVVAAVDAVVHSIGEARRGEGISKGERQ
jgi:hypothetical protein